MVEQGAYMTQHTSYQYANDALKHYLKIDKPKARDFLEVINELEKHRIGVVTTDSVYQRFIINLSKISKVSFTSKELQTLAEKGYCTNIKSPEYWHFLLDLVKKI